MSADYNRKMQKLRLIRSFGDFAGQWEQDGFALYLLGFQFTHLNLLDHTRLPIMTREIERIYTILLTRVCRHPTRVASTNKLPRLLAVPDRPVFKHKNGYCLADVIPNDALHWHALLGIPLDSRLHESFDDHYRDHNRLYRGNQSLLIEVDVKPIKHDPDYVADYMFKHIKRGSFNFDDILILPKSRSQLSRN
jgi:hypothetical protein